MKLIIPLILSLFSLASCMHTNEKDVTDIPKNTTNQTNLGPQGESSEKTDTDTPNNVGTVFETSTTEIVSSGTVQSSIR